ncbi:MAG: DNA-binding protein [Panacagrimonas sp.]
MTYDQVAKAAEDLRSRLPDKKGPSVRNVFAAVGGDYRAVQKHMRAWRLTQVSASPGAAPTLSPGILRALSEEITQQRNLATASQSAELDDCREELEDLQRECSIQSNRVTDLEARLQEAVTERERVAAERDHQIERSTKLQEQVSAERAAAENARIDLAQTRLKTSGDSELVKALRADVNSRRDEVEAERAARIEAERKLAAAEAALVGLQTRMSDHSTRLAETEADRNTLRDRLEDERNKRVEAERERDIAEARATAASARADDLWAREADLRARIDHITGIPSKSEPIKPTAQGEPARS